MHMTVGGMCIERRGGAQRAALRAQPAQTVRRTAKVTHLRGTLCPRAELRRRGAARRRRFVGGGVLRTCERALL